VAGLHLRIEVEKQRRLSPSTRKERQAISRDKTQKEGAGRGRTRTGGKIIRNAGMKRREQKKEVID